MKITGIILLTSLLLSCAAQKRLADSGAGKVGIKDTTSVSDSTVYELLVFDPDFDFWFQSHSFSKIQYTNEYLQSWNHLYAQEWNRRYSSGDRLIGSYIDYDLLTKYDFEFNFKLYMYFKFFEEKYRIKLLPGSSRPL
jgi:hypothetical protein